jgi:peptide/nickel transport system ATP-binding protein
VSASQAVPRPALEPLLEVDHLTVAYGAGAGSVRAVEDVSLRVGRGEVVGLAGESGSGKSTLALAIARLLRPPARKVAGTVRFEGVDVYGLDERALERFRWARVSFVFQSALHSLNPVLTVGTQIVDAIVHHEPVSRAQAVERAAGLLRMVGVDPGRLKSFPHQLSGGQRQRVVIAMALALRPPLVILDEPTTALDVVVQRDILRQVQELKARLGFSILFITHDLSLLGEVSDRVLVMYAGRLTEAAPTEVLFRTPAHPYTKGLMTSFPTVFRDNEDLVGVPGSPPDMRMPPSGCRFHPRCPAAMPVCAQKVPALLPVGRDIAHLAACHLLSAEGGTAR